MVISLRYPFEKEYPLTQGYSADHPGLDWGAPLNTPVLAAADGQVLRVAEQPGGYGLFVVLLHDGNALTLYAHLNGVRVSARQRVREGQVLGFSGSSGNSSGPHLHFEFKPDGKQAQDPSPFFEALPAFSAGFVQPPAGQFSAGEWVILKPEYAYVNLRPVPSYAAGVADIGDYTGGAAVQVLEQSGEMIAVKVWLHAGYVQPAG